MHKNAKTSRLIALAAMLAALYATDGTGGLVDSYPFATTQPFDPADFWREPADLPFDAKVLETGAEDAITWQSMVYTSEIRNGEPMRIFAYYARPAAKGQYPGVVDIHGGGRHADLNRAKAFAKAGYACLSYDWNNHRSPKTTWKTGDPPVSMPYTVYGTMRYDDWAGQFSMLGADGKGSVLYRSVIAARRALTWLGEQKEVDANRLAVEGHSWGGFTTQLVAGVDPRVKAAVSSAAAGAWVGRYHEGIEGHVKSLSPWDAFQWFRRYDPASFADHIKGSILIRLGTADFFGSVDTLADYWPSIQAPKSLELLPAGNHTFDDVATRVAWFDHWLKGAPAFPQISNIELTPGKQGDWTLWVQAAGPAAITKAAVAWTTADAPWSERLWAQRPLDQKGDAWIATFTPVNAGSHLRVFASVQDANGRTVSTMPLIRPMPKAGKVPEVLSTADVSIVRTDTSVMDSPEAWKQARTIAPMANGPEVVGEQSASLDTLWDNDALYLRLQVDDPSPWTPRAGNSPWHSGDSIQLRLRTDDRAAEPATQSAADRLPADQQRVLHLGWYPDPATGAVQVDAVHGMDYKGTVSDVSPVVSQVKEDAGQGYTLIARIPWSFIDPEFKPADGRKLRLGLQINYGDLLTPERIGAIDFNCGGSFNNSEPWGIATLSGK